MSTSVAFGVDIGGTKVEIALVDDQGYILDQLRIPTDVQGGADKIISDISTACLNLATKAQLQPSAVGVGVAGQIDSKTGVVRFGPNLRWRDVPLKENLQKLLHLPVAVTNDVRAAGWGEWLYGAGENSDDIVCLFIGTGVGGAIVSGGHMLKGEIILQANLVILRLRSMDLNVRVATVGALKPLQADGLWQRMEELLQRMIQSRELLC